MDSFTVAAVFSNHCVLQRGKNICIFGEGTDGNEVTVSLADNTGTVIRTNKTTVENKKWRTYLAPLSAQTGCTLTVSCNGVNKTFSDVAIGEVWLAGGQSNMEFELGNCTEGPAELANEKCPNVRFYYTQKISWMDSKFFDSEKKTSWQVWGDEWTKAWSAVGYFFAKQLAKDLGVTVGVIGCNWGGTSASAWMDKAHLEKDSDLKTYLDEYEVATKDKSIDQQLKEYDAYERENAEWQKKCDEQYRKNPKIEWDEVQKIIGPCLWPGPKSCKNPFRPSGLYECMLKRVMPYSLKGFIYYQGESDDHKPRSYYKLFTTLIRQWREDWEDNALPFLFVQLPMNRYRQDKDHKNWCLIREAQLNTYETIKNTGMACAADLGQYNDIHPKAKKVLAERMEKQALHVAYHLVSSDAANGPIPQSCLVEGNKMTITFAHAADGFVLRDDKEELEHYRDMEKIQNNILPETVTGFELAGSDGVFYPATFGFGKEQGKLNTIMLNSTKVDHPKFARYAWYNYGPVTVFARNGIPLTPFRTSMNDEVTISDGHAAIQQIMEV